MKIKPIIKPIKKFWYFFWQSDSPWSWLANIVVAFLVIKFLVYPFLGWVLGTPYPVVAVISESMEHGVSLGYLCGKKVSGFKESFDNYWAVCGDWYEKNNISKTQFQRFPLKEGFRKGDIVLVWGSEPENLEIGDVLIFQGSKPQPIIHRLVRKWEEGGKYFFQTKGDHNKKSLEGFWGETKISEERILGKGVLRIPYLGWVKILFVQAVRPLGWTITK